jgi:hypothetical protein
MKVERDEYRKMLKEDFRKIQKMKSNIQWIGLLKGKNRENDGKEVIFKRIQ